MVFSITRRTAENFRPAAPADGRRATLVLSFARSHVFRPLLLACFALAFACTAGATSEAPSTGLAMAMPAAAASEAPDPLERLRRLLDRGARLEHGEGTQRDFTGAHRLYCEAAREQFADAFVRLGWMYANGRGVSRDDDIAHSLFRRAGELGSDLGARLAGAVKGAQGVFPACLVSGLIEHVEPPVAAAEVQKTVEGSAASMPTPAPTAPAVFRPGPQSPEFKKWMTAVLRLSAEFRLDPRLVFALIRAESNFDPGARSAKNAQGLMQLIPETAERFAVRDVWDPLDNLRGGMSYLRWLLSYFKGDVMLALAGYNAGEGAVDRYKGVPPFPETLAYVQRIRALYPLDRHPFDPKAALPLRAAWLSAIPTAERLR